MGIGAYPWLLTLVIDDVEVVAERVD